MIELGLANELGRGIHRVPPRTSDGKPRMPSDTSTPQRSTSNTDIDSRSKGTRYKYPQQGTTPSAYRQNEKAPSCRGAKSPPTIRMVRR